MKRFLYLTALLLAAAACAKSEVEPYSGKAQVPQLKGNTVITARIDATKASANTESGKLAWMAGDSVSVWVTGGAEPHFVTFFLNGEGGAATGKFVGTLDDGEVILV